MSKKLPYFSRGSYAALKKALDDGIYKDLDRVIYYYVTEGKYAGDFCIVYKDKTINHASSSDLSRQLDVLEGDVESLSTKVNEEVTNITTKITDEVDALSSRITSSVEDLNNTIDNEVDSLRERISDIRESSYINWDEI